MLKTPTFADASNFFQLPASNLVFTTGNVKSIRDAVGRDIELYCVENGIVFAGHKVRRRHKNRNPIRILVPDEKLVFDTPDVEIRDFMIILNELFIPKEYFCKVTRRCNYSSTKYENYERHISKCAEISKQNIKTIQHQYGEVDYLISKLHKNGYLPEEALEYRKDYICTYDIETLEHHTNRESVSTLKEIAVHRLCSVAVANNHGRSKCFIRDDSTHKACVSMVSKFVKEISWHLQTHEDSMPNYFDVAMTKLEADAVRDDEIPLARRMILKKWLGQLKKYCKMDIYGFNSGES